MERKVKFVGSSEYVLMHRAVKRKKGKASKCSNPECKYPMATRFDWALITGRKYSYNPDDYIQLCHGCHRAYDAHLKPKEYRKHRLLPGGDYFRKYIKSVRLSMGLSQKKMAEFCGVGMDLYNAWEGYRSVPDLHRHAFIARKLGIRVDDFLSEPKISTA